MLEGGEQMAARDMSSQQQRLIGRFAEYAAAALNLSRDGARRVVAQRAAFEERIRHLLAEFSVENYPSMRHVHDLIPEGLTVVEDVEPTTGLDMEKLEYKTFLERGEDFVVGDEMRQRAVELKGNLGLSDAKSLLANQDKIPVELRDKIIILPGTVLRNAGNGRRIPVLYWNGDRWCLDFTWLNGGFDGHYRLVCISSPSP